MKLKPFYEDEACDAWVLDVADTDRDDGYFNLFDGRPWHIQQMQGGKYGFNVGLPVNPDWFPGAYFDTKEEAMQWALLVEAAQ